VKVEAHTLCTCRTEQFGDHAPENADLYFAYGKALLEHAISQNTVLGKQGGEDGAEDNDPGTSPTNIRKSITYRFTLHIAEAKDSLSGAFFSFSGDGDADDDGDIPPDSDAPVDLFAEAEKAVKAEDDAANGNEEDGDDDEEPEDDFNAAWEILDLARTLFDKRKDEDEEIKLKLADTYVALGDVSLETGICYFIYITYILMSCTRKI
jgi:HAT1-interacting factor 1